MPASWVAGINPSPRGWGKTRRVHVGRLWAFKRDGDSRGSDQLWDSGKDQPSSGLAVTSPET